MLRRVRGHHWWTSALATHVRSFVRPFVRPQGILRTGTFRALDDIGSYE